jgi:hypothetical protein
VLGCPEREPRKGTKALTSTCSFDPAAIIIIIIKPVKEPGIWGGLRHCVIPDLGLYISRIYYSLLPLLIPVGYLPIWIFFSTGTGILTLYHRAFTLSARFTWVIYLSGPGPLAISN